MRVHPSYRLYQPYVYSTSPLHDCDWIDSDETCWGQVQSVWIETGEDASVVYACEGHITYVLGDEDYFSGIYTPPEKETEDG